MAIIFFCVFFFSFVFSPPDKFRPRLNGLSGLILCPLTSGKKLLWACVCILCLNNFFHNSFFNMFFFRLNRFWTLYRPGGLIVSFSEQLKVFVCSEGEEDLLIFLCLKSC